MRAQATSLDRLLTARSGQWTNWNICIVTDGAEV